MVFGAYWTGKPKEERAEQEQEPRQPCGHPVSAIRCDREGEYCWLCCHAEEQEGAADD